MGTHMKTTIDIADPLLARAKLEARRQGTTLRELVERGLMLVVNGSPSTKPFVLAKASVPGDGVVTDWQALNADDRVAMMYEG
jgi:hypothetical protein